MGVARYSTLINVRRDACPADQAQAHGTRYFSNMSFLEVRLPDGSRMPVDQERLLGRGSPAVLVEPSLSRQQFRLTPMQPGALLLENVGVNGELGRRGARLSCGVGAWAHVQRCAFVEPLRQRCAASLAANCLYFCTCLSHTAHA